MAQTTLREYLQMTEDAINSDRVTEALSKCQYILAQYPELLEARRLLGEVYLKQGHLREAQQTFDWVLTNDPENVVTYCSRALICEQLKDYDTALDCYQQAYELSRGISHIRQEFNQLSEKVGQPGFIFSRAGLARLYMRGDLLTQAVQEWESVLASAPGRLDAHTGLLETYWREGLYDRVEQLAKQILSTVPQCLKALVLLAHVTFAQNALQAQELMGQAQALDPDMVIARELFSDFMIGHPKDPFLKLLKRPTAVLVEEGKQPEAEREAVTAHVAAGARTSNGTPAAHPTFSDPLGHWSSLDTILEPQRDYQAQQQAAPNSWGGNTPTDLDALSSYAQATSTPEQEAALPPQPSQPLDRADADAAMLAEQHFPSPAEDQRSSPVAEKSAETERPWYHLDRLPTPADTALAGAAAEPWDAALPPFEADSVSAAWETEEQNSDLPAPPAWLDMLTRGERRQPADAQSARASAAPAQAEEPPAVAQVNGADTAEGEDQAVSDMPPPQQYQALNAAPEDDDEGSSFGPAWLKSLGAAVLESPAPVQSVLPEPLSPAALEQPMQTEPPSPQATPETAASLMSWLDQAAEKLTSPDQSMLKTLEDLEINLRSRGFTQLEPGSLSSLALAQPEEPSLSSALAQLGNFERDQLDQDALIERPQANAAPIEPLCQDVPEPPQAPLPHEQQSDQAATPANHLDALSQLFATPATPANDTAQDETPTEARPVARPSGPAYKPAAPPAAYSAMPLDIGLETTMKRPAVRLQSIQQRVGAQAGANAPRSHQATSRPAEGGLSNKERLLKGYQYQLAGSYDDAMQEYRIIIRAAPDLLGEVISNMRALLKLAPKYSAGYRVLGDAYMRQGEYLQAMEAYNKALTMAKKAKS